MTGQCETISLLPAERLLKQLLLECRDDILSDHVSKLEIRFAGGWVRDKLLGIHSSDIDVTLSTMTGMEFGEALRTFYFLNEIRLRQEAQRLGVVPDFNGPFKIGRNLEKSKNLETAVINIFGLDVDLVNLRKKTEGGRISQIEFGTPEEDAALRDATINALYYNLDKHKIEDFTGKGLKDMAAGIMRTPKSPHETFMDDPLRVLRVIRFASKLGYTIGDATKQSMKDERIHTAFGVKINRQRIGTEVAKMMNSQNPLTAFQLIHEMGLCAAIFLGPAWEVRRSLTNIIPYRQVEGPWPPSWANAYRLLASLLKGDTTLAKELVRPGENREHLWLLAAYAPIARLRSKPGDAAKCMTEALKTTTHASKLLEKSLQNMDDIVLTVDRVVRDCRAGKLLRSTAGVAIRSWGVTWRLQVLYSLLAEVTYEESNDGFFATQLARYSKFVEFVVKQELQDAPLIKQILTAGELKEYFELKRSGDFMKGTIDGILRWQFDNRDSSREEALEWLTTQKEHFGIPSVGDH